MTQSLISTVTEPTSEIPVITIDGTSGVGKGTVSNFLAKRLQWHQLDSGMLYRVLALAAMESQFPSDAIESICSLSEQINFLQLDQSTCLYLQEKNLQEKLRSEQCAAYASKIAANPKIRKLLIKKQRAYRKYPGLIADGRDMGTVIFPDAIVKLFLNASLEVRATRRANQLRNTGTGANLSSPCKGMDERDERDIKRVVAPLQPAKDAVIIDTTMLSLQQVLDVVWGKVEGVVD